jgi:hypothetical protein
MSLREIVVAHQKIETRTLTRNQVFLFSYGCTTTTIACSHNTLTPYTYNIQTKQTYSNIQQHNNIQHTKYNIQHTTSQHSHSIHTALLNYVQMYIILLTLVVVAISTLWFIRQYSNKSKASTKKNEAKDGKQEIERELEEQDYFDSFSRTKVEELPELPYITLCNDNEIPYMSEILVDHLHQYLIYIFIFFYYLYLYLYFLFVRAISNVTYRTNNINN